MGSEKNTLTLKENFLCFFLLVILGLGSIISWGVSASFLVMEPLANFIHRCIRMVPGPKIFLIPGLLLFIFLIIWLLTMVITAYRQHRALIHFLKNLTFSEKWPEKLKQAAALSNITTPLDLSINNDNLAFSYGLLFPRIIISQDIVLKLELEELQAILLHEESHSVNRDPLRIFLVRMAFSGEYPIKLIPKLIDFLLLSTEITADDSALTRLGNKSWALASALLKIIQTEIQVPDIVPGATTALESRIDHLITPSQKPTLSVSKTEYAILMTYLLLTFGSFAYSYQHFSIWLTCH